MLPMVGWTFLQQLTIKIILQSCPQANMMQAIPQLRLCQADLKAIQDSKQIHGNKE